MPTTKFYKKYTKTYYSRLPKPYKYYYKDYISRLYCGKKCWSDEEKKQKYRLRNCILRNFRNKSKVNVQLLDNIKIIQPI